MTDSDEIIRAEGLTIGYGEMTVLENIDLSISQGEIFSILGPSGCGKSTLIKALTGLLVPFQGGIFIAGEEISHSDPQSLVRARQHLGVLFQSGALIGSMSVADNVELPLQESTDLPGELIEWVVQLKLQMVKLGGKGQKMPSELSNGMRKRVALARSMALDPEILFCDEPSSGLDPVTALEIDELLLELNGTLGMTMVIVSHELPTIQNLSDRCIMLNCEEKGIIASGTVDELENRSSDQRVRSFFSRRFPADGAREKEG